jgi:hypothetical protein
MRFGGRPGRSIVLAAAIAALVVGTAALASGSAIPVSLKAGATNRVAGQSVRLTATAKLPRGDRLLIIGLRAAQPRARVAECPRSPCSGTFRSTSPEVVVFQASVIKRTGSKITTLGRSRPVSVSWTEPPPPPPTAVPGHYEGRSSQNEIFNFDVTADGRGLTNLQTGQVNQSCDPPAHLSGGNVTARGPYQVALDGTVTFSGTFTGTVGGSVSTNTLTVAGRISGGTASGTFREDTTFTSNGAAFKCSSGDQTWTATRVG